MDRINKYDIGKIEQCRKGYTSEDLEIWKGLRQGDTVSTVLFNLVLELIIKRRGINRELMIFNNEHRCTTFADDVP